MNPDSNNKSTDGAPVDGTNKRFNPLLNEADMFKVLVGVIGAAAILVVLVLVARAIL